MKMFWRIKFLFSLLLISTQFCSIPSIHSLSQDQYKNLSPRTHFYDYKATNPNLYNLRIYVEQTLIQILREYNLYEEPISLAKNWQKIRRIINGETLISPTGIEVLPTTECNLSCLHCRSGSREELTADKATHEERDALQYIDEMLRTGVKEFRFSGITGDPLMNLSRDTTLKSVASILEHKQTTNDTNIKAGVITNGLGLDSKARETLVDADYVNISLDGVSPDDYQKIKNIKIKNVFEQVLSNTEKLAQLKEEKGTHVQIIASFLIRDFPRQELEETLVRLKKMGVNRVVFKLTWGDDNSGYENEFEKFRPIYEFLEILWKRHNDLGQNFRIIITDDLREIEPILKNKGLKPKTKQCYYALLRATLSEQKDLMPCCHGKLNELPTLGNLDNGPFDQIWGSQDFIQKVQSINPSEDCGTCFQTANRINELVEFLIVMSKKYPGFLAWFEATYIIPYVGFPETGVLDSNNYNVWMKPTPNFPQMLPSSSLSPNRLKLDAQINRLLPLIFDPDKKTDASL